MGRNLQGNELGRGISQRADGRYYARAMVCGKPIAIYGRDLETLRRELAMRVRREEDYNAKDPTVYDWFNDWFKRYKIPDIKESSIRPMISKVVNTIMPPIAKKRISKLRPDDIRDAVNASLSAGVARGSVREALQRLTECLDMAVANGYIDRNPASVVMVAKGDDEGTPRERRYLTMDEIAKLLQELENDWWYELVYVMIFSGLRIGEVGGLQWEDIDFQHGLIKINHTLYMEYDHGAKHLYLATTKTRNSVRTIPMMGDVKKHLKRQQKKVQELKQQLGPRYRGQGEMADLVFVTSMGSPATRYNVQKVLKKAVDAINAREMAAAIAERRDPVMMDPLYPHALRHTFATLCHDAKIDALTTQRYMGHANYSTTANIYTHLDSKSSSAEARKMDDLAQQISGNS